MDNYDQEIRNSKKEEPKEKEEKGSKDESKSKKHPKTHTLPKGTKIRVYESEEDVADPYTVVLDTKEWDSSANPGHKAMLSLGKGGRHVSQFGEGKEGPHLGKSIACLSD